MKRIYIPLPDAPARLELLDSLLAKHKVKMSAKGIIVCHVAAVPCCVRSMCCSDSRLCLPAISFALCLHGRFVLQSANR